MYLFDRRHSDRFLVAGATVHFQSRQGKLVQSPLSDLTHSSLRFEITENLIIGDEIEISVDVPGFNLVRIRGNVVWTSDPLLESPAYAVVQFLPFGTDPRYNSMQIRDQIKIIIKKFSDRVDPGTPL